MTTIDYGSDLSCVSDLTPHMLVVSGNRLVAEAIARRLQTPKGALLDDSNYGYDVTGLINADIGPGDLGRIAAGITAECQKDQRVFSASVDVEWAVVGPSFGQVPGFPSGSGYLAITISLVLGSGPFTLVLAASQVTVAILQTGT